MKEKKLERDHGHGGLEPGDVELLFPDPAGDSAKLPVVDPAEAKLEPCFEEPWPAAPIDDSAEVDADPAGLELPFPIMVGIPPREKSRPIKPIGYPPRTFRRLAPLPSSSSWFMELQKILLGD
jgi:hypothetical protein